VRGLSKQGFIKLHRKIHDHWIYQEKRKFSKYEAWLDMLMMANHKENKFVHGNELILVGRGEFITSIRKLGERWDWSNTKVAQFLDLLKADEMIDYKKDTKKTVVTIVNYGFYHGSGDEEKTPNEHEKDTNRTQKHTNKNVKECIKNEKELKPSSRKFEPCDMESAKLLFQLMQENNPDVKQPNFDKWADDIRKIRTLDNRTTEQIDWLIKWTQKDSFWSGNILSPSKLRKQWDQLVLKAKADHEKKSQIKIGTHQKQNKIDWDEV
jgi:hypothetical protein